MVWTIVEVARASSVTSRTLRHYDAIGLLRPASIGGNGYREYGQEELLRLREQSQQKNNRPWHGGYQGGGSHDVHGGKGGAMGGPADEDRQKLRRRARLERIEATLRAMQDNDSQAYLAAEGLMTDTQKPRARELFSQAREALLAQLDALHYQLRKGDY